MNTLRTLAVAVAASLTLACAPKYTTDNCFGVIAGLVKAPVIAVPTSVGYGASFGGISALLTMLNTCAEGVTVVNIDNGFGAAIAAFRMLKVMRVFRTMRVFKVFKAARYSKSIEIIGNVIRHSTDALIAVGTLAIVAVIFGRFRSSFAAARFGPRFAGTGNGAGTGFGSIARCRRLRTRRLDLGGTRYRCDTRRRTFRRQRETRQSLLR